MLVCVIVDHLFNEGKIGVVTYAKAGQYAENKYWLKGSGLLDQLACAVGGMITIDFADIEIRPSVRSNAILMRWAMIWLSSTPEKVMQI